jgi:hypothetical protein
MARLLLLFDGEGLWKFDDKAEGVERGRGRLFAHETLAICTRLL